MIKLGCVMLLAFMVGKVMEKIKLPSILGWLLAGIAFGPNALGLLDNTLLQQEWYQFLMHILECFVGVMIGEELVFKRLKKSGKQLVLITLTQSIGTFIVVSLCFALCFYFMNIPIYVAFIFGSIALATAPAPALSIVKEFRTNGPVTKTLIPMAALDDMVGVVIFFTVINIVGASMSTSDMSLLMIPVVLLLPLLIGGVFGFVSSKVLTIMKKYKLGGMLIFLVLTGTVGYVVNEYVLSEPILNFLLMGMAFSMVLVNTLSEEVVKDILEMFQPVLMVSMIAVILNLGAPLDYRSIAGAGFFTFVYILARGIGKYGGAYIGSVYTKADVNVKKYLGLTLLPHSGVSLVFTGIACTTLATIDMEMVALLQGTITAAAIINEIIAVLVAKKGFELANEYKA